MAPTRHETTLIAVRKRITDQSGHPSTFADIEAALEHARQVAKVNSIETDADRDLVVWQSLVDLAALVSQLAAYPHDAIWQMTALRVTASGFGKVKIAQLNPTTGEWFDTALDVLHGMFDDEPAAHAAIEAYQQKHGLGNYHTDQSGYPATFADIEAALEADPDPLPLRVCNWQGQTWKTFETLNGAEWKTVGIDGAFSWTSVRELMIAVAKTDRVVKWSDPVTREQSGALVTDRAPAATPATNGAFRIVTWLTSTNVCVERYSANEGEWTLNLSECEPHLWPWRTWDNASDAEAAILAYGTHTDQPVTIVRHGGTKVGYARPGSGFPTDTNTPEHHGRSCPCSSCVSYRATINSIDPTPIIEHVTIPNDTNTPEHDGTFRIIPTLDTTAANSWFIQRWSEKTTLWRPMRGPNFPPAKTYWEAVDHIAAASARFGETVRLAIPSAVQIERWKAKGITITDPVNMTATIEDAASAIADLIQETGALIGATTAPVTPAIGEKKVAYSGDGVYVIETWTAEGWSTTVDDLAWEDAEEHIMPEYVSSKADGAASGECRISPSTELAGTFDVIQWTGKNWNTIAGTVTKRTAEGVIQARKIDPETVVSSGSSTTKQWRKMMKGARADLRSIIKMIDDRPQVLSSEPRVETLHNILSDIREICEDRIKQMSEG